MKRKRVMIERLEVGDMVKVDPYDAHNNAALHQPPFVGLYLGFENDPSGRRPRRNKVLGPDGLVILWGNQWHLERIPEFVGG